MKRAPIVILLGSLLVASAALATTYVRVEKDGTKTYSDRPIPGGTPIDIQPAQTYSAPPPPPGQGLPAEQQSVLQAADYHYSCALIPRNDETFSNPETVAVTVNLSPSLRVGDTIDMQVDGAALPGTEKQTSFSIPQPLRGTHSVTVQVKDRFGKSLCSSNSTFHVLRTSLNSPARQVPRPAPPRPTPH
jgi:hypothetical protein